MAYFAKLEGTQVVKLIVADQEFVDQQPGTWVEYKKDGSIRGNPAKLNGVYDAENDVFLKPQPYPSWTLNTTTWQWEPPVAYPSDGHYRWSELQQQWIELPADIF